MDRNIGVPALKQDMENFLNKIAVEYEIDNSTINDLKAAINSLIDKYSQKFRLSSEEVLREDIEKYQKKYKRDLHKAIDQEDNKGTFENYCYSALYDALYRKLGRYTPISHKRNGITIGKTPLSFKLTGSDFDAVKNIVGDIAESAKSSTEIHRAIEALYLQLEASQYLEILNAFKDLIFVVKAANPNIEDRYTAYALTRNNEILEWINEKILDIKGNSENEFSPEFKTKTQKLAWLHELGILKAVLDRCREQETYNWSKAARIIQSFTEIKDHTIRKALMAIYQPETNQKNNPLNNPDNKLFVSEMKNKFGLNKKG